jgi:hypothetical protein
LGSVNVNVDVGDFNVTADDVGAGGSGARDVAAVEVLLCGMMAG